MVDPSSTRFRQRESPNVLLLSADPLILKRLTCRLSHDPLNWRLVESNAQADLVIYFTAPWTPRVRRLRCWAAAVSPSAFRRLYLVDQSDVARAWAPGLFVSLQGCPSRHARGGFYTHFTAADELLDADPGAPSLLWTFVGSRNTSPTLRGAVINLRDPRGEGVDSRGRTDNWTDYVRTLQAGQFVVCPRGRGPATHRIFEAMRAGRTPVIISDAWTPPPGIDWRTCSLRVPESDVADLPRLLREREWESPTLGARARVEWRRNFSGDTALDYIARQCTELGDTSLPARCRLGMMGLLGSAGLELRRVQKGGFHH